MRMPSQLNWQLGFARFLWDEGILILGVRTVYRFLPGDRKVIGTRQWVLNHRFLFKPWESPYLRWRMHTVFATPESALSQRRWWATLWKNREQFVSWVRWHHEMLALRENQNGERPLPSR